MVKVANKSYEDRAYVEFEGDYGLEKISHQNKDIPMIYFPVDDVNYAIAILAHDTKEIPLSFVAKTMGEYTISIKLYDKVFDEVYLVDNMTGSVTNMMTDDYTFVASADDRPDRFVIKLIGVNSINENLDNEDIFVYVDNDKLFIDNISSDAVVGIYDMMGRIVSYGSVKSSGRHQVVEVSGVQSGVYIVRVSDKDGIRTQKVIL